jgi:PHD/YefM family antitoxin component YafN of YafNO toxin-antitoxin module
LRNKAGFMVQTMPITKARINLGAVVKRIHLNKEYVILEKDGIPIVGIMDIDEFEDYLEAKDPQAQRDIAKSNEDIRAGRTRPARELLTERTKPRASKSKATKRKKA